MVVVCRVNGLDSLGQVDLRSAHSHRVNTCSGWPVGQLLYGVGQGGMRFACPPADFYQAWFVRIVKDKGGLEQAGGIWIL